MVSLPAGAVPVRVPTSVWASTIPSVILVSSRSSPVTAPITASRTEREISGAP